MWNPGFAYEEVLTAKIYGYHRALCVFSWHFRGTKEKPGLVLGLDHGGSCKGRAFRVVEKNRQAVMDYLTGREMVTDFYNPKWLPTWLGTGTQVEAYGFVADPTHEQYAGNLSEEGLITHLLQGEGRGGRSIDYLRNVIEHLDEIGIPDGPLHKLFQKTSGRRS